MKSYYLFEKNDNELTDLLIKKVSFSQFVTSLIDAEAKKNIASKDQLEITFPFKDNHTSKALVLTGTFKEINLHLIQHYKNEMISAIKAELANTSFLYRYGYSITLTILTIVTPLYGWLVYTVADYCSPKNQEHSIQRTAAILGTIVTGSVLGLGISGFFKKVQKNRAEIQEKMAQFDKKMSV